MVTKKADSAGTAVVDFHGSQDQGARAYQEDAWFAGWLDDDESVCLLVVADGMGGEAGGAEASRIAIDRFVEAAGEAFARGETDPGLLAHALEEANRALRRTLNHHPELDGFGCTLVGGVLRPASGTFHWISVGDSPLWLVRDGQIERLNADHSMAPVLDELVEIGRMTADEARHDNRRHQLRSAVTGDEITKCDLPDTPRKLAHADVLLLASDGLDTLDPARLAQVPATGAASSTVATLLDAVARESGEDQDNVTVVATHYFVRGGYGATKVQPAAGSDGKRSGQTGAAETPAKSPSAARGRARKVAIAGVAAVVLAALGAAGTVLLDRGSGTLVVEADVAGASVHVDGEACGAAGEHGLAVRSDGYAPYEATIKVPADGTRTIEAVLEALPTELVVRSNVRDDRLFIDGEAAGSTGPELRELEAGERQTVRAELSPTTGELSLEVVGIPGGSFRMGDLAGDGYDYENPVHRVTIEPFRLMAHEVTFAQWDACVEAGGCNHEPKDNGWGRGNRPVIDVSWEDVTQQFIPWLNEVTGGHHDEVLPGR